MKSKFHKEAAKGIANAIISELYLYAKAEPKIMVTNWLAYAYELICQETKAITGCDCGTIEVYFDEINKFTINKLDEIIVNKFELDLLRAWHEYHSLKSSLPEFEQEYRPYTKIVQLKLPNFTLN